ncbi:unnamed protein product [Amoebophrya sp. A120]|nr:unnamed protein product [Amoebophrya sp. A120]|eukprot:GSA120T00023557001.1
MSSRAASLWTGAAVAAARAARSKPRGTTLLYLTLPEQLQNFVSEIPSRTEVGVDLEGHLGRFGKPSLLQIYSPALQQLALVDLLECNRNSGASRALKTKAARGTTQTLSSPESSAFSSPLLEEDATRATLRTFFQERTDVRKIFHDCREDAAFLRALYDIKLQNAFDTQVAHLAHLERKGSTKYLASLPELLRIFLPGLYKERRWDAVERAGQRLHGSFSSSYAAAFTASTSENQLHDEQGDGVNDDDEESYGRPQAQQDKPTLHTKNKNLYNSVWEHRPLSQDALHYAAEGSLVLPHLAAALRRMLRDPTGEFVARRTQQRYLPYAELNRELFASSRPADLVDKHGQRCCSSARAEGQQTVATAVHPHLSRASRESDGLLQNHSQASDEASQNLDETTPDEDERTVYVDGFVTNRTPEGETHFSCNGLNAIAHKGFEAYQVGDTVTNLRVCGRNRKGLFVREHLARPARPRWGCN